MNMIFYKKPTFWILAAVFAVCIVVVRDTSEKTAEEEQKEENADISYAEENKEENMGIDYVEQNGQYIVDGDMVFRYKKELKGRMPNAESDSKFIVLTNDDTITFEQVAKSFYSSLLEDSLSETIVIGME